MKHPHSKKFAKVRNYQSQQQAFLIGLLNDQCDIVFQKPFKISKKTLQFLTIKLILFPKQDEINFSSLVKQKCESILSLEMKKGLEHKTAIRRFENNKHTIGLDLLRDILEAFGYFFNTKKSSGKKGTLIMENIYEVFHNDVFIFSQRDIITKGEMINKYLTNIIRHSVDFTLPKNCNVINNIMCHI
ncbi:hypothetical protein ENU1_124000 [Entamoeba nuttalli P19]|uniref:Uncharacterized protein n=1 Tax=Entamoeba nuttalli (strain P19) TaxID=1076696 RepID=K2GAK3_ENTNP|nr:hypothetical protein ENU1_124000 [Entamoeba nuttalli P19]EKE39551.1 hypothetical protein ENU1_124000 [Entamoeba nuttalli P19]|eukprot:XP_008858116.1 hypothetical protein ENU1_124000 [Entamoeba nuttalli P19]